MRRRRRAQSSARPARRDVMSVALIYTLYQQVYGGIYQTHTAQTEGSIGKKKLQICSFSVFCVCFATADLYKYIIFMISGTPLHIHTALANECCRDEFFVVYLLFLKLCTRQF